MSARRSAYGTLATDHFYPATRGCLTDEYRCATIERLLSDKRQANLAYTSPRTPRCPRARPALPPAVGQLMTLTVGPGEVAVLTVRGA